MSKHIRAEGQARAEAHNQPEGHRPKADGTRRDPVLEDPTALEEIDLYSDLVIAATESDAPLTSDQIDRALGVKRVRLADSIG